MTAQTRAANKAKFEQGDQPQGTDYEDLVDSFVSISDTTAQSISSPLAVTGALGASTTVSANAIETSAATFTQVSANTAYVSALVVSGIVSAQAIEVSALNVSIASAASLTVDTLTVTTIATAQATATAIAGDVMVVPTTAAGYITFQVCGATAAIPFFRVS